MAKQLEFNFELIELLEDIKCNSAIVVGNAIAVIGKKIKVTLYGIKVYGIRIEREIKKTYSSLGAIGIFGNLLEFLQKSLYKLLLKGLR